MPGNFYGVKVRKNMRLKYKIDFLSYLWGSKNLICVKKIFILDPMFLYNFFSTQQDLQNELLHECVAQSWFLMY